MKTAICSERLSKKYYIAQSGARHDRLGEKICELVRSPFRKVKGLINGHVGALSGLNTEWWALKDLSFEIRQGEVVGIIGRNGAGKSSLLKVLSRITEPTTGYVDMFGRVGSLLEVGTGFHPELTGRENVYLNGAILGMKKTEIRRKMESIIAFAELETFTDTPVKHYSSGMYVRLAFSVAAHLEPDILLVDEVLAVGDAAFQRRCLDKMDDVAREGRTVLFVSHNMGLVQSLCQRGILLDHGRLCKDGPIKEVVNAYLQSLEGAAVSQNLSTRSDRRGLGKVRLMEVQLAKDSQSVAASTSTGDPVCFIVQVDKILPGLHCNLLIHDSMGQPVTNFNSKIRSPEDEFSSRNGARFYCEIDELCLRPGRYRLDVAIVGENRLQDFIQAAMMFDVNDGNVRGRPVQYHRKFNISLPHRWTVPVRN